MLYTKQLKALRRQVSFTLRSVVHIIEICVRIHVNIMNVVCKIIESILNTTSIQNALLYNQKLLVYIKAVIANMFQDLFNVMKVLYFINIS